MPICRQMQNVFILCFRKRNVLCIMLGRYWTTLCNANEYKMMGQVLGPAQLYDVHNQIKNSDTSWLYQLIYYYIYLNTYLRGEERLGK